MLAPPPMVILELQFVVGRERGWGWAGEKRNKVSILFCDMGRGEVKTIMRPKFSWKLRSYLAIDGGPRDGYVTMTVYLHKTRHPQPLEYSLLRNDHCGPSDAKYDLY